MIGTGQARPVQEGNPGTRPGIRPGIRHWLRPAGAGAGGWWRVARELALAAVFVGIYEWIRENMVQAGGAAASHALSIVSAEQSLGWFHERAVQELFIASDNVMDVFNAYYGGTHFLVPAVILAWLLWRHPGRYARARTTLALATAIGFVCFWLYPVAPPRLLPARFGIVDTLTMATPAGHAEGALISAAGDQYASMPSLHVAWAVWCAVAVYPLARHWALRLLAVAYPVMTALVVVATGNHFFFDVGAGALLTAVSWVMVEQYRRWAAARRARPEVAVAPAGIGGADRSGGRVGSGPRVAVGGRASVRTRTCGRSGLRRATARPRFCAAVRSSRQATAAAAGRAAAAAAASQAARPGTSPQAEVMAGYAGRDSPPVRPRGSTPP